MNHAALLPVAALLALAGCAGQSGPVVGDWRGHDAAQSLIYPTRIEVILDGPPGARAGTYHYVALPMGELLGSGQQRLDWTDRWEMHPVVVNGQEMQALHLANLAGAHVHDFLLTPQNLLVPEPDLAHPDLTAAAYQVALAPVPRDSFGYGRP